MTSKSYFENKQFYSVSNPDHTISITSDEVNDNGRNNFNVYAMEDGNLVSVEQAKRDINLMFGKKKRKHSCKRNIYKKKSHKK